MSVYIKGMEKAQNCDSCMFSRRSIFNVDWCVLTEKDLPCDCPILPVPDDIGEFSDGYHTFNGLYYQRMILFAALVRAYITFFNICSFIVSLIWIVIIPNVPQI